ncbi:MAG: TlyA family RNA methyltransferase [Oscillospiraceae bacterium]|nr:TlyA family RNA methyltransferase [Ruminococcus sp.]MDE6708561.1 TlyA family RNA methyltransferase [Oscillospiraceae bacterium]
MAVRIDIALAERGLCQSRSRAKLLLKNGKVLLNGEICTKPSVLVENTDKIILEDLKFVGRGGLKLEHALQVFSISPENKICMDIGASTGGFTDCMLQNHAKLIYAIDVGHDQLAEKLKNNLKVISLENTDIRNLKQSSFLELPEFCSIDVSFISLKYILPSVYDLLANNSNCVALVKPQFEAGKKFLNKQGVVKSEKIRLQVLQEILDFAKQTGFIIKNSCQSPIQGGSGNIEYLVWLKK